jgi:gamma-glutamyl-gamma-aminobutyrate hydrolase PuuD
LTIATVTDLKRFEGDIPTPVILTQTTQKEIHQAMDFLDGMVLPGQAVNTLASMNGVLWHSAPYFLVEVRSHYRNCGVVF